MNGPYYGFLGCPNPSYEQEIQDKELFLSDLFGQEVSVLSQDPEGYRNKIEFSCSPSALGLKSSWDTVVDIEHCPLIGKELNAVWKNIRLFVKEHNVSCFDPTSKTGWLCYVTLRIGVGVQVVLTTTSTDNESLVERLVEQLGVASLYWMINPDKEGALGTTHKIYGEALLVMSLSGKEFFVRPESFFQANTQAATAAIALMKPHVSGRVLDLYCGVGALGQCLPHDSLVGVEENSIAVELANKNASHNGLIAEYHAAPAATFAAQKSFDTVIVDPPRTGLGSAVHILLSIKPKKIVYLSCNPKTQRRDLAALRRSYDVSSITGIDFFPRTPHVECLVTLDLRL